MCDDTSSRLPHHPSPFCFGWVTNAAVCLPAATFHQAWLGQRLAILKQLSNGEKHDEL